MNTKIKTSLTLIDGIYEMEQGPDFLGTSYRTNFLIAGRDILSCDIVGSEVRAKKESKNIFLLGNGAIAANKDLKDGIKIKGCPPPIIDTVMSFVLKSLPPKRVAKILMSRMIKNIGTKIGESNLNPC